MGRRLNAEIMKPQRCLCVIQACVCVCVLEGEIHSGQDLRQCRLLYITITAAGGWSFFYQALRCFSVTSNLVFWSEHHWLSCRCTVTDDDVTLAVITGPNCLHGDHFSETSVECRRCGRQRPFYFESYVGL